ncbi:MAG TPA: type II secretion system protein GspJ [Gammaproteobacteria bacterium]|nr:type II secretion system protein GspJ [Gammaproteobacteria bacterium]
MMQRQAGFTLLELLVALSIFALISAMAYGGLQGVMNQQQHTSVAAQRLADLQKAYRIMQRDLEQIAARRIRNEFGDPVEALVGGRGFTGIEFSRAGHPNPAGFLRSELQRVAYVPGQDTLLRQTWRVLDRAQDTRPDEQVLVEGITRFSMRFLDSENKWQEAWPPPQPNQIQNQNQAQNTPPPLPLAVDVQLELEDYGILNWIFRLPAMYVPTQTPGGAGNNNPPAGNNGAPT